MYLRRRLDTSAAASMTCAQSSMHLCPHQLERLYHSYYYFALCPAATGICCLGYNSMLSAALTALCKIKCSNQCEHLYANKQDQSQIVQSQSSASVYYTTNHAALLWLAHHATRQSHKAMSAKLLQVNYHGPYILTRLLEPVLIASKPSRVVNVASVEHRIGYIKDIRKFMFDAKKFLYSETKLGNVLLTYEHQRRLGAYGVQVCLYSNTTMTLTNLRQSMGLCTSTAFVVHQYCLPCLPVLPSCLPHWIQVCCSLTR